MKHYIYIDKEMLDSYISQIYGGIVKNEKNELSYEHKDESSIKSPEMEIKSKIEGGISKLAQAGESRITSGLKVVMKCAMRAGCVVTFTFSIYGSSSRLRAKSTSSLSSIISIFPFSSMYGGL